MQTVLHRLALLFSGSSALLGAGCDPTPGPGDVRTLHCERVQDARSAALCKRMEGELEFRRGGHAMLFGIPAWRCTERTFERLVCNEPRVGLAAVKAAQAALHTSDFSACLVNLQLALEHATLPKDQRKPPFDISCE